MIGSALLVAAAAALLVILPASAAGPRVLLQSNAGPYNENSLLGVPSEVHTGETYGQGEKVNVCKFPLGSVNNWNLKPEIQYLPVTAELILETSGRGSFIAPAVGFLHYGPSCYLYDHVCNFNYQEPCNLRGDCQTNNTCFCTNGFKSCVPHDGTLTSASAGCETNVYTSNANCGECNNVCPTGTSCNVGSCVSAATPSPPPPPPATTTPSNASSTNTGGSNTPSSTGSGSNLNTPGASGLNTPATAGSAGAGAAAGTGTGAGTSAGIGAGTVAGSANGGASGTGSNIGSGGTAIAGSGNGGASGTGVGAGTTGTGTATAGSGSANDGRSVAGAATAGASTTTGAEGAMTVVPGSNGAKAARQAARKAADAAAAAAATAGRRLLNLVHGF